MAQQRIRAFFFDRLFHPARCGNALKESGQLVGIRSATRHATVHGLPRSAGALIGQAQHIVAQHGLAGVAHPQKIAAIFGGCHAGRAVNDQFNKFATIGSPLQAWQCLHIHRELAHAFAQAVQHLGRHHLSGGR